MSTVKGLTDQCIRGIAIEAARGMGVPFEALLKRCRSILHVNSLEEMLRASLGRWSSDELAAIFAAQDMRCGVAGKGAEHVTDADVTNAFQTPDELAVYKIVKEVVAKWAPFQPWGDFAERN